MKKLVLMGGGGHCKSTLDTILQNNDYCEIVILDDRLPIGTDILGCKVIGNDDMLIDLFESGFKYAFVCVGYMGNGFIREKIFSKLIDIGFIIPNVIDKTAVIARDVQIGAGTFIGKNAIINSSSKIGKMVIINSSAIIEHDCIIGDYSHVAVNSTVCGGVVISSRCLIGAGAVVIQGINVKKDSIIGAGAVVLKDIEENCVAIGVPAKVVKRNEQVTSNE